GLAFSPDGRHLASGSFDKTVRLWEAFSGQTVASWKGHQGSVSSVALSADGRVVVSGSADTTLLLWDVTGRSKEGKLPALALDAGALHNLWGDLASEDTARGNRALWDFVAAPKESLPFLDRSFFLLDPEHLNKLLKDLDDKLYRIRANASKELERYGRWVEDTLKNELKKSLSEEVRRRVEDLLKLLAKQGSLTLEQERVRYRRAMLVLEQDGSAEAELILTKIARGGPEPPLRAEAQMALERLKKRAP